MESVAIPPAFWHERGPPGESLRGVGVISVVWSWFGNGGAGDERRAEGAGVRTSRAGRGQSEAIVL